MWIEKYKDCLTYIDHYWNRVTFQPQKMRIKRSHISALFLAKNENPQFIFIPHPYFVPNDKKLNYIYYWDSYFMFRGIMGTKRQWLMREMVENFAYLFEKYQIIPNFNAAASFGRSQPPFLSSMVLDTYLTPLNKFNPYKPAGALQKWFYKSLRKSWLKKYSEVAKREYETVWIDKKDLYNHRVDGYTLARYGDRDIGYAHSSELESGWDFTSRFYNRCDQFLPIDLNCYLYKYEIDFAKIASILGNTKEEAHWKQKAEERKAEINKYMWDEDKGIFADYGYVYKRISTFRSLASFTPLWAGLATPIQAERSIKMLNRFETSYGLTITSKGSLAHPMPDISKIEERYHPTIKEIFKHKQWDYPNIWAPLEYLTVIGLLRYGYKDDAYRIMKNSIKAHAHLYRKYKTFFEKLNGENGESGRGAMYGDQEGFGWTNAVFYRYIMILTALDQKENIFIEDTEKTTPPYTLSILH